MNYLLYQLGWIACVFGAARAMPWWGALGGAVLLLTHVALARRRHDEFWLAASVGGIGLVVDTLQIQLGTLAFGDGVLVGLPPAWLLVTWMQFATTFRFSMRWLQRDLWGPLFFGAIGGPLAFVLAEGLGVVTLHPERWKSVVSIAVLWAIAIPLAATLGRRQDGRLGEGEYRAPRGRA